MFQPRFDEERSIYRDCQWCGGNGCVCCRMEAEAAYKREFPDGPKPIATFKVPEEMDDARAFFGAVIEELYPRNKSEGE